MNNDINKTIGVVGLGSMGKRRIRLLEIIRPELKIIGIDSREDRRKEAEGLYGIETGYDLAKAIDDFAIGSIVVSTSPVTHADIINTALKKGCHVFTEINLVDDLYEENISLSESNNLTLFLSSTMMYRKEIQFISDKVNKCSLPVNYAYHVGQFLPTWHSWESYKDFFVADKRTNGCREVFAIELPWIIESFGKVISFDVKKGRMTNLDINYPDNYELLLTHESGTVGTLNINVASQFAVRNLEVYGQDCYMKWEGTPQSLYSFDQEEGELRNVVLYDDAMNVNEQNATIIENAYEQELRSFFKAIIGEEKPRYSFNKDRDTLKLIDAIEGNE